MSTSKTYTKEEIIHMLDVNDRAVTRAVIAIYQRQTPSEQAVKDTKESNNIGFNSADARLLSYYAEYAINNKCLLSGKHLTQARNKIKKYWRQLLSIANS
jgi:hypothetical protein